LAEVPNITTASQTAKRTIRDADRAAQIVKRLRALFVREQGTLEWVDLNAIVRDALALTDDALQMHRIGVDIELSPRIPRVMGDAVQLQQVILNLIRNAMDAMNGGDRSPKRLSLKTERGLDDSVCLSVCDTGVGIDPQQSEKVFEPFYTTKHDGMGVGLSVSRSIIETHGGRLWASPNPGPGTTFAFFIPGGSGHEAEHASTAESTSGESSTR
jgi:signal transduction histidine kinase